jgi:hypothetical protein
MPTMEKNAGRRRVEYQRNIKRISKLIVLRTIIHPVANQALMNLIKTSTAVEIEIRKNATIGVKDGDPRNVWLHRKPTSH